MAGDWIKMRVNLVTHPKVMAIAEFLSGQTEFQDWSTLSSFIPGYGCSDEKALRNERYSALRVTRYVTVCALLRFWGYANEHAHDEFIAFMSVDDIDEVVQIPRFGAALESVGWISCAEDRVGLELPDFNKFNAVASDRSSGAERQKRYRERKKLSVSDEDGDVTRDVTVTPREEKRREEKKHISSDASGVLDYLNQKAGRKFEATPANTKLILARMKEGATVEQMKAVVDAKVSDWLNDPKMSEYLRPATLFNAEKFGQYAGALGARRMNGFHDDSPFA